MFNELHINARQQVDIWAVRINKFVTSGSYMYLTARTKLNCSQQYCIVCLLLVLNSFMRNRLAIKSREFIKWHFVQIQHLKTIQ